MSKGKLKLLEILILLIFPPNTLTGQIKISIKSKVLLNVDKEKILIQQHKIKTDLGICGIIPCRG